MPVTFLNVALANGSSQTQVARTRPDGWKLSECLSCSRSQSLSTVKLLLRQHTIAFTNDNVLYHALSR